MKSLLKAVFIVAFSMLSVLPVAAQELEPRSYSNVPVGLNFVNLGYAYSSGGLLPDPSINLEDAELQVDTPFVAYTRSVSWWGLSGKAGVVQPYACLSGTAKLDGEPVGRDVCGLTDTLIRLAVNFLGAPALSMKEFGRYQQNWIVGATLRIQAPTGQYDASRLVNLGNNRWRINPELGVSKAIGRWIIELAAGVSFYTDNDQFLETSTREQAPVFAFQTHVIYSLPKGMWIALDANFYRGGESRLDGVEKDDRLENSRLGFTYALPLGRRQSLKFVALTGLSTRTGSDADTFSLSWQYRWGRGF